MQSNQIILEKPIERSGVYAIINLFQKRVYVGETNDYYRRMSTHIPGICNDDVIKTNQHLMDEEDKRFDVMLMLTSDYDKLSGDNSWIIDETLVMYLFRKYGFALYNGNDDGEDNIGAKRRFLNILPESDLSHKDHLDALTAEVKKLLMVEYGVEDFDERLSAAEKAVDEKLRKAYRGRITLATAAASSPKESAEIWEYRLSEIDPQSSFLITQNNRKGWNYKKICEQLINRKLSVKDMENCGLKRMSVDDFASLILNGRLDHTVFSKFGSYLSQSPITILSAKCHDLSRVRAKEMGLETYGGDPDSKVCLWSLRNLSAQNIRYMFSNAETDKSSGYVILNCTPSMAYGVFRDRQSKSDNDSSRLLNRLADESMDDFCTRLQQVDDPCLARRFTEKIGSKLSSADYRPLPPSMFPPIIEQGGKKSIALLVSELYYLDADYEDHAAFYRYFYSLRSYGKPYTDQVFPVDKRPDFIQGEDGNPPFIKEELSFTFGVKGCESLSVSQNKMSNPPIATLQISKGRSSQSHACAALKFGLRQDAAAFVKAEKPQPENERLTSTIIAKVEYPYVVQYPDSK